MMMMMMMMMMMSIFVIKSNYMLQCIQHSVFACSGKPVM